MTLTYTPNNNFNGTDSIRVGLVDTVGVTDFIDVAINIAAQNDAPSFTVATNLSVLSSSAGFSSTVVASSDDGDPEVTQGLNYSVIASNATAVGANSLTITSAGVLSFTPTLETIGILSVTVQVIDDGTAGGAALTSTQVVTVQILDGNTAPSFNAPTLSSNTNEDTAVSITIPAIDGEANFNGFSIATNPANGSASIIDVVDGSNATATLTYTPNSNFNGTDSIRVGIVDTSGLTDFIDVTVNIAAQNDAPSFTALANLSVLSSSAGFSGTIVASSDDGDPEITQGLAYSVIASNASAVGANNLTITSAGVLSFAPTLETVGVLSLTVQVTDDATAGGAALSTTQVVTVQILNGNTAPTFSSATLSENTNEDAAISIAIPAIDGQGNFNGFSIVTNPANGSASITDVVNGTNATVTLTYTPNNNFNGIESIRVGLVDTVGLTDFIDVSINVAAQNDVPSFTIVTNLSVLSSSAGFSNTIVASSDDGDPEVTQGLSYSIIASNALVVGANNLAITSAGVLTFAPTLETIGVLSVTVQLTDDTTAGGAALSSTEVVEVQILNGNTAPAFNSSSLTGNTNEDTALTIAIPATDAQENFNGFSIATNPANGVATITDIVNGTNATVTLTYTPNINFNGTDSIRVGLVDTVGLTDFIDVSINVIAQNDVPSFTTVASLSVLSSSAGFSNTIVASSNDGDPEISQGLSYSIIASNALVVGANNLAITSAGILSFEPTLETIGVLSVTVQVTDDATAGGSALTSTQVVTVQILDGNTAPSFNASTLSSNTNEDTAVSIAIAATDSEGNFNSFSIATNPDNGVASVADTVNGSNATVTLTYTPNSNFNGTDSIRVGIVDTSGLTDFIDVTVNVVAQNDAPSFTAIINLSVLNSSAGFSSTIVASSDDGDPEVAQGLSYSVIASNATAVGVSNLVLTNAGVLSLHTDLGDSWKFNYYSTVD